MSYTATVKFWPHEGDKFSKKPTRLLILGEAHYSAEKPYPSFTQDLTKRYMQGRWSHRYWTILMKLIGGEEAQRNEFWREVAFYNYIQSFVADRPGVAPSPEMWGAAEVPFREVLRKLRPTHILVVSKRLWDATSHLRQSTESNQQFFPTHEGPVWTDYINHPCSRGFRRKDWRSTVGGLLEVDPELQREKKRDQ